MILDIFGRYTRRSVVFFHSKRFQWFFLSGFYFWLYFHLIVLRFFDDFGYFLDDILAVADTKLKNNLWNVVTNTVLLRL